MTYGQSRSVTGRTCGIGILPVRGFFGAGRMPTLLRSIRLIQQRHPSHQFTIRSN
ncbi:MAG: hypothetical protein F6K55_45450 [Moorea sp. SIO4A3]|nr:hypothetical protein [Moorena sp. SIO4A3]